MGLESEVWIAVVFSQGLKTEFSTTLLESPLQNTNVWRVRMDLAILPNSSGYGFKEVWLAVMWEGIWKDMR